MKKSVIVAIALAFLGLIAIPAAFGRTPGVGYTPGGGVELPHSHLGGPTVTIRPLLRIRIPLTDIIHRPIPGFDPSAFSDTDGDGVANSSDNCPEAANPDQLDSNSDGVGDVCDDTDGDTIMDNVDNCKEDANADQADFNEDGMGDACDDTDGDGFNDDVDNCVYIRSSRQFDQDEDGLGDYCDNCRLIPNPDQADSDEDHIGDVCEIDWDGDGVVDDADNCMLKKNADQIDTDEDGMGDACDDRCEGPNCPSPTEAAQQEENLEDMGYGGGCSVLGVSGDTTSSAYIILVVTAAVSIARIRRKKS